MKEDFLDMLKEGKVSLSDESQWKRVKASFSHDPRYKAVDSSSKREELFEEYIQSLQDKTLVC